MASREPAVAGSFYSADAEQLRQDVDRLLGQADLRSSIAPKAMIVPHAGYVYSGPVAAAAYRLLEPLRESIRRVALFGPAHRVYLDGMAIPASESFRTPLGTVPLDAAAIRQISELPGVCISDLAHAQEHSLEVQLPFLQMTLDEFQIVPVVVGQSDSGQVARVIDTLWGGPETLIVISSDLSHYLTYEDARRIDQSTGKHIHEKVSTLTGQEACGAYAVNGLMRAQHCKDLDVETIDLRNSGDTAGDKSRVVGYGAFILH
jgi:AmmeMemoRadiSam system protein B